MENSMDQIRIDMAVRKLREHGFEAECVAAQDIPEKIRGLLAPGSSAAFGGSETLKQLGVIELVRSLEGVTVYDRYAPGLDAAGEAEVFQKSFGADYYLMSSNAVTAAGELFNVDGRGNRVAALTYGPRHVLIIAGSNKLVWNEHEAWQRIKAVAAPKNCVRLNKKTPCVKTGKCEDCSSPERICTIYVKTEKSQFPGRVIVWLVPGEYGY